MAKILATKITLIESTDSPHVEDGKNTCYFQDDLDIIKGKANFHCFSYYKIEKIDDETIEDDLTVILGIDSNKEPLIGINDYAALPCPPYCDDDPLPGENNLKGQCIDEEDIEICKIK